jgi:hypothetical protein
MRIMLAAAAMAALSLSACNNPTGTAPQGSKTAAAMPDTTQPREPDKAMTAPDAGATGAVPANGAPPAAAPEPTTPAPGGVPQK